MLQNSKPIQLSSFPKNQGLYDSAYEKDGCGIGLVASISGQVSSRNIQDALSILARLRHRGAEGADPDSSDGCGILTQIPDAFFRRELLAQGAQLPDRGAYGVGVFFFEKHADARLRPRIGEILQQNQITVLYWREVPRVSEVLGYEARVSEPVSWQCFIAPEQNATFSDFEGHLYRARLNIETELLGSGLYSIPSFSSRTIVYKGLMRPDRLREYYPDLGDPEFASALAMVHSRFSTNTFPSWSLAHPYRFLCHNGEINALKGNLNALKVRQARLGNDPFTIRENQSDSACLDQLVEFLVRQGRSLPHAMMMAIPEPWEGYPEMDAARRGFYEYHSSLLEPWDGPAAVAFTDGVRIGATLDRNGLRPCRYWVTTDDRLVLSSEAGVLPMSSTLIREKGRLSPGRMILVDTSRGTLLKDDEIKAPIVSARPYEAWVEKNRRSLDSLPSSQEPARSADHRETLEFLWRRFSYTEEEIHRVIEPMAVTGEEAVSSMGIDTPLAVLSLRPLLLFNYFKQLFAQVTNPPIDSIRERLVMSLASYLGPESSWNDDTAEACARLKIQHPVLNSIQFLKLPNSGLRLRTLRLGFSPRAGELDSAIRMLCQAAEEAVDDGAELLVLSDRDVPHHQALIPSLLAVSSVHTVLTARGKRGRVGLVIETGEARDVHQFACLLGFGAGAIYPYLAFETIRARAAEFSKDLDEAALQAKYVSALGKGLLKIFSKMGISTLQSYSGASLFQAIGISDALLAQCFPGAASSKVGGIGFLELGEECVRRHQYAVTSPTLDPGSEIHWRAEGESHDWEPEQILLLQEATRRENAETFQKFSERANRTGRTPTRLRDLLEIDAKSEGISLSQVESASEIVKRFTTGAMSLGAISREAHETLAIAMNRIGAKSNTGEGGESAERFVPLANGDSRNSAIKQVASARFGVTAHYLSHAREIQIKVAQGAKPGEGGQLPGHKVDTEIARLRHSTPGVPLISPPPHHDIYSIEDLKQLIFDLNQVNESADISVKLVSEGGVGVVAAGVAKAHANKIVISGDNGGTGAAGLSSIRHAGLPWELGLAETHQTLMLNRLRGQVRLETDGQLKTGRDVAIAALLGADEFGFATAPLIVEGCLMMRKCHLNICPVGIATQDPALRAHFKGQPEHVVQYFFYIADELREIMARLGFRSLAEMIGRSDRLKVRRLSDHWKAKNLDLSPLLYRPSQGWDEWKNQLRPPKRAREPALDPTIEQRVIDAIHANQSIEIDTKITNAHRAVGTFWSGAIAKHYGPAGLVSDQIQIKLKGEAGQSFGAFLAPGLTLNLTGEANDYVGKGLSGGRIVIAPEKDAGFDPETSVLIGNTALYGATSGEAYFSGVAGERFAVRNSGATVVVEGVGDHACEYMTGGTVVILGQVGRNFAAGMSGGSVFFLGHESGIPRALAHLSAEAEVVSRLPETDQAQLLAVIREHYARTRSPKAVRILAEWSEYRKRLYRWMPDVYRRAIELQREKEQMIPLEARWETPVTL